MFPDCDQGRSPTNVSFHFTRSNPLMGLEVHGLKKECEDLEVGDRTVVDSDIARVGSGYSFEDNNEGRRNVYKNKEYRMRTAFIWSPHISRLLLRLLLRRSNNKQTRSTPVRITILSRQQHPGTKIVGI